MEDDKDRGPQLVMVAVFWPDERDYARFCAISADYMPPTVAEFRANLLFRAAKKGWAEAQFIKVAGDPDELVRWCRDHGRPVDTHARADYLATLVQAANDGAEEKRSSGQRDN